MARPIADVRGEKSLEPHGVPRYTRRFARPVGIGGVTP